MTDDTPDWQPGDPVYPRRQVGRDMIEVCDDDDSGAQWRYTPDWSEQ